MIEAARAGIHLDAECGNGSAMKDVCRGDDEASVCANRESKAIVDFEKAKMAGG